VFVLLAIEELGNAPEVESAVAAVSLTVLLSVVLHGFSAGPLGSRYVRSGQSQDDPGESPRSRRAAHESGATDGSGERPGRPAPR
jgi:sodium/hydrogen antiporter